MKKSHVKRIIRETEEELLLRKELRLDNLQTIEFKILTHTMPGTEYFMAGILTDI